MHYGSTRANPITSRPVPVLLSLGFGLEICFLFMVFLGDLQAEIILFLISFTLSFIIYLITLRTIRHLNKNNHLAAILAGEVCIMTPWRLRRYR